MQGLFSKGNQNRREARALLKISEQTLWQLIVKLITTTSGFVILGVVARQYGEAGTGSFTLALIYLAFFYVLVDFGLNAQVLRRIKNSNFKMQNQEFEKLLGARILWSFILITVAIGLLTFLPFHPPSFGFSPDFKLTVVLGILTIFFYGLKLTATSLFQAHLRYDLDILPTAIGVILGTLLIVLLSILGVPIYVLVLGYVVAWSLNAGGALFNTRKLIKSFSPIFDLNYTRKLFKESSFLAATLVLNVIYFRVDAFILSYYHSPVEVGIYNTAYQFFQAILVLPTFIMNAFYPMMLDNLKLKATQFFKQVKIAFIGLLAISILISGGTYLLAPFLTHLVTGSGFEGSILSLRVLSYGFPAFFLSSLMMWVMIAKKKYKSMIIIYAVGLVFNLVTNLIFIPAHSYIAASWVTGVSEYLILLLQLASLFWML